MVDMTNNKGSSLQTTPSSSVLLTTSDQMIFINTCLIKQLLSCTLLVKVKIAFTYRLLQN